MIGYLVDTNVIIDWLRGHRPTGDWLYKQAEIGKKLWISAVTVSELYSGIPPEAREVRSKQLAAYEFQPVSFAIARLAGELRYRHLREGTTIPLADRLQAAVALNCKTTVATSNEAHFPDVDTINPRLYDDRT